MPSSSSVNNNGNIHRDIGISEHNPRFLSVTSKLDNIYSLLKDSTVVNISDFIMHLQELSELLCDAQLNDSENHTVVDRLGKVNMKIALQMQKGMTYAEVKQLQGQVHELLHQVNIEIVVKSGSGNHEEEVEQPHIEEIEGNVQLIRTFIDSNDACENSIKIVARLLVQFSKVFEYNPDIYLDMRS